MALDSSLLAAMFCICVNAIDMSNAEEIDELEKIYNEMTDYEKVFVASDTVTRLNQYIERRDNHYFECSSP